MKRWMLLPGPLVVFLAAWVAQAAFTGVVIEQVMRERDGRASKAVLYFSDQRLRTDHEESGLSTIMDFKRNRIVMIDHHSRSYVETKFSEWEKEVSKELRRHYVGEQPKARKIVVNQTGDRAVIHGFQTEKVEILADGELIEEDWVTRDVNLEDIEKVMERVARGFTKEIGVEMKEGREIYEKLKPYGYPILVRDHTVMVGKAALERLEVVKLERRDLPEDLFLPPKGYKKIIPEHTR